MGYTPALPQFNRNARLASRPVLVRPSGTILGLDPSATSWGTGATVALRIIHMPPNGLVFVDDAAVNLAGGRWDGADFLIPVTGEGGSLRIVAPNGDTRAVVAPVTPSSEFNWDVMPRVASSATPASVATSLVGLQGVPAEWSVWVPIYRATDAVAAASGAYQVDGFVRIGQSTGAGSPTSVLVKAGEFAAGDLRFRSPTDSSRWVVTTAPFTAPAGSGTVVDVSGLFARPLRIDFGGVGVDLIRRDTPTAIRAPLTVVGPPGWLVALAPAGSTVLLGPPVPIPVSGGGTVPVAPGTYNLGVSDGVRAAYRGVTIPVGGTTINVTTWLDAPVRTGLGITGLPAGAIVSVDGRVVTGEASGARTFFPLPPAASVTVQIVAGGVTRRGPVGIPTDRAAELLADGLPIVTDTAAGFRDVAETDRGTQGPTTADAAKGMLVLLGVPPQSTVAIPGAGLSWTVDASGRPVAFDLQPGTYGVTVTPPSGPLRTASGVVVAAGGRVELVYGTMAVPSAIETLATCDVVGNPPPGVPANVCEGASYTATDGTRWLAVRDDGKMVLRQQAADGTIASVGWSTSTKVILGLVVAAGVYAAWKTWGDDGPRENPGKRCSCGGGH